MWTPNELVYFYEFQLSVNYKTTSKIFLPSNEDALPTLTLLVSWLSRNNINASAFSLIVCKYNFSLVSYKDTHSFALNIYFVLQIASTDSLLLLLCVVQYQQQHNHLKPL